MCGHEYKRINDVSVCIKCGLTITSGKAFFDKKIVNWKEGKRRETKK